MVPGSHQPERLRRVRKSQERDCVGETGTYIPLSPQYAPSGRREILGESGRAARNALTYGPNACPDGRDWMAAIRRAVGPNGSTEKVPHGNGADFYWSQEIGRASCRERV